MPPIRAFISLLYGSAAIAAAIASPVAAQAPFGAHAAIDLPSQPLAAA